MHTKLNLQSEYDTTGFNFNTNGNYESNFKDYCKTSILMRKDAFQLMEHDTRGRTHSLTNGKKKSYLWQHFVTTPSRTCVLINVEGSTYYQHQPCNANHTRQYKRVTGKMCTPRRISYRSHTKCKQTRRQKKCSSFLYRIGLAVVV